MAPSKTPSVKELRELARKHLVKGYSKLTKQQLVEALQKLVPDLSRLEQAAPVRAVKRVASIAKRAVQRASPASGEKKQQTRPRRVGKPATKIVAAGAEAANRPPPVRKDRQHPAEPLVEGFFVARVAGEEEARRHHLTEELSPPVAEFANGAGYDERLGELPHLYGDDAAVLLPRDPHTLYFFWDFSSRTTAAAMANLEDPRAVIRLFDGDHLVREVDFALESHSFYIHGLIPGRRYRVEAVFVGRDGQSRRIGRSSNAVLLPRTGPSEDLSVRFMRVSWGLSLAQLQAMLKEGRVRFEERAGAHLEAPSWMTPSSASWAVPPGFERADTLSPPRWTPPPSGRP